MQGLLYYYMLAKPPFLQCIHKRISCLLVCVILLTLRISLYSDAIYGLSCAEQGRPLRNLFLIGMNQLKVGNGHSKQKNSWHLSSEHCIWSTETTQWTQFFSYFGTIISSFDELYTKVRNTRMWTLHDVEEAQAWQFQVPTMSCPQNYL